MDRAGDGVFTTLAWDGRTSFCAFELHMARFKCHAEILKVDWPTDFTDELIGALNEIDHFSADSIPLNQACRPAALLTIELHAAGIVLVKTRSNEHNLELSQADAITVAAPRNDEFELGVKQLDWSTYLDAGRLAAEYGVDVALLVHDGAIIDGDRATPMLLATDGTAWVAASDAGAVDSITLKLVCDEMAASGIPLNRGRLTRDMFSEATEAVLLGTGMGITALNMVDGRRIGAGGTRLVDSLRDILKRALEKRWSSFDEVADLV